MDTQAGPMAAQMKSLGIKAKLLGGDGAQSQEFIKLAGPAAEGNSASSPGVPLDKMPGGKGFADKFTGKYGQIQIYAPYAYDATMTLIEAMQKANSTDPAKYLPELAKIEPAGRDRPHRVRREGRPQERPDHALRREGRQVGAARDGGRRSGRARCRAAPYPLRRRQLRRKK